MVETTGNYGRFYRLLGEMPGMDKEELKKQLVSQWSNGRTESLREMSQSEYRRMCDELQSTLEHQGGTRGRAFVAERRYRRSVCLRLLQKVGVDTTEWDAVNRYCMSPRIAGKAFRELTLEELDRLSLKLRVIQRKKAAGVETPTHGEERE